MRSVLFSQTIPVQWTVGDIPTGVGTGEGETPSPQAAFPREDSRGEAVHGKASVRSGENLLLPGMT